MKDIAEVKDIEILVNKFYEKLMQDSLTAELFKNINIGLHLPKFVDFWAFVLLDKPGYTSNVFDKHSHLKLKDLHFNRWLLYWSETIHELFEGPKATMAIERANLLALTFQAKLKDDDDSK